MRFSRLIIGLLVILVAGFIIVGEQLAGASANAVINARVTTLRAQVAGTVALSPRVLGSIVQAGEELGSLQDPLVDTVRLNDLVMEMAYAQAALDRQTAITADLEDSIAELDNRTQAYRDDRIAELEADDAASTPTRLSTGGQIALEAAREGRYLGDGFNDAPFSEQLAIQRRHEVAAGEAAMQEQRARIAALESRIAQERVRANRLGSALLSSPVAGRLWEVLADNGEIVQRGQDVLRVVNCGSAIVTLSVTENVYNRLEVGSSAQFRMNGDDRVFDGTVARLAGSGAETIYRNLAVAPSLRHLERFDVAIIVPTLREDAALSCAIGRTGRVFFEARPLDFLRRFWN
jgi:multidrug resistance efflux pump